MKYFSMFSGIGGLYKSGKTQKELAEIYKVSQAQVSRILKRLKVKARIPKNNKQSGKLNKMWKGDNAGYTALHYRVEKIRGKPKKCEVCGSEKAQKYEWANLTGNYKDPTDYKRMCSSCHAKHDNKIKNITK